MLGSSGGLVASSGEGGGGGGETVVASSSSIMSGGIGDEENKGGGVGGGESGGEFFEGDRSTGGNRWPRQETLALLKIRSDMDAVFRDSSLKSPLWEEVSRKMAELGYHRSSKKCKEKFENVFKYHKRTKDGRVGKSDGKTYRFFDQLEAFEQHQVSSSPLPPLPPATPRAQAQMPAQAAIPVSMVFPAGINSASVTVTSSSPHPISVSTSTTIPQHVHQSPPVNVTAQVVHQQQSHHQQHHNHHQSSQVHHSSPIQMENVSYPSDTPSSSSTSSDEELLGRRKRKRKWKDFFEGLMKEVIDKQEQLQTRFLEAVEKREHDRLAREEVWKTQEMGRLNREHEILVQERSMAAAKDAALIELLKKLSDHHQIPMPFLVDGVQTQIQTKTQVGGAPAVANAIPITTQSQPPPPSPIQAPTPTLPPQPQPKPQPKPQPQPQPQPVLQIRPVPQPQTQVTQVHVQDFPVSVAMPISIPAKPQPQPQPVTHIPLQAAQQPSLVIANTTKTNVDIHESNNGKENHQNVGSSRWPKAEVQALINLRTKLDEKYQENGPKGPLWEEISTSMKELGYNRNAKRCKEKWENINKYFKKVKESNKKRPEDSKTCPYFHQLDALYRRKATYNPSTDSTTYASKPENLNTMGPIMAQPDQRWHTGSGNDSEDDGDDDDDDDQGNVYEIVANNNNGGNAGVHSMNTSTATTTTTTATAQ